MRFMAMMIPGNPRAEEGVLPDEKLIGAMMKYNQELAEAGVLLGLDGLHPTSKGARVRFAGGRKSVTDGPFAEAREVVGGYWLWKVGSKQEAIDWALRCPAEDGDTIELRQLYEPEDFGPQVAEQEAALMDEIGKRMGDNAPGGKA